MLIGELSLKVNIYFFKTHFINGPLDMLVTIAITTKATNTFSSINPFSRAIKPKIISIAPRAFIPNPTANDSLKLNPPLEAPYPLPIIFPALGAAFALVFLDAMKELTATLLLSPTGLNTLATAVWAHTSNVEFAAAAPYAALLILVSGLPVYLLTTRMYLSR